MENKPLTKKEADELVKYIDGRIQGAVNIIMCMMLVYTLMLIFVITIS